MSRCKDKETGKVRYGTRERAVRIATRRATAFRGLYLSVYHCEKCDGWHLSKRRQA